MPGPTPTLNIRRRDQLVEHLVGFEVAAGDLAAPRPGAGRAFDPNFERVGAGREGVEAVDDFEATVLRAAMFAQADAVAPRLEEAAFRFVGRVVEAAGE